MVTVNQRSTDERQPRTMPTGNDRLRGGLSEKVFGDRDLLEAIRKELAATKANPHNLIFEVAQPAAIANIHPD